MPGIEWGKLSKEAKEQMLGKMSPEDRALFEAQEVEEYHELTLEEWREYKKQIGEEILAEAARIQEALRRGERYW